MEIFIPAEDALYRLLIEESDPATTEPEIQRAQYYMLDRDDNIACNAGAICSTGTAFIISTFCRIIPANLFSTTPVRPRSSIPETVPSKYPLMSAQQTRTTGASAMNG